MAQNVADYEQERGRLLQVGYEDRLATLENHRFDTLTEKVGADLPICTEGLITA